MGVGFRGRVGVRVRRGRECRGELRRVGVHAAREVEPALARALALHVLIVVLLLLRLYKYIVLLGRAKARG